MLTKKFFKNDTIQNKYLISFFTIALIVDLLVSLLLCFMYSFFQIKKTTNSSIAQMKQVCASTDLLYESMESIVTQVQADADTNTFLISSKVDRLKEVDVGIKIRSIRTANPSIRYITLYNSATKRFVSTAAAGYNELLETDSLYDALGEHSSICCFRSIGANTNIQSKKHSQVYTFIFSVNRKALDPRSSDLVIIDVNANYFDKALTPICVKEDPHIIILQSDTKDTIAVMNSPKGTSAFTTVTGDEGDNSISLKKSEDESSGYYFSRNQKSLKFTTFARADRAGWTIYSILPYDYPLEGLNKMLLATLILSALMLVLGYAFSSYASQALYAPIQRLYENYVSQKNEKKTGNELDLISEAFHEMYSKTNRLEQGLITSYRESQNLYLNYLLLGKKRKVESSLQVYQHLDINLSSPYFAIVLIECTPRQTNSTVNTDGQKSNQFIHHYALDSMLKDTFPSLCNMDFLHTDENRCTLLLYLDDPNFPEKMDNTLNTISQTMQKNFSLDTTICVGNIVSAWRDINLSYEQAQIALNSYTVEHYGKVFYSQDLPETITVKAEQYFNSLRTRLTESIRNDNLDSCAKEIDFALMSAQNSSFKSIRSLFRHVLMSVLDNFPDTFKKDNDIFIQLIKQLERIDRCYNVQSLKETSLNFLSLLNIHVHANRKNKNLDIAYKTRDYIDQNFSDPNLSLQILAEMVDCSPAYLGKTFTAVTTFTFNDYLNNVRMEKAAELLTTTKDPINKISEEVGILNSNYFYSLFKKRYGVTPSAYRKKTD